MDTPVENCWQITKKIGNQFCTSFLLKKRMDYLSNMYLNAKNNPFDYLESEENSIKRKFSKFIPKSATIFKERKDNFNVHLIKKFSDFKMPSLDNQCRSKTANMKNKSSN